MPQGQIYLRLRALAPGETYTVTTPRGAVTIAPPGRYDIVAGDTDNPTRVTVLEGSAQVAVSGVGRAGRGKPDGADHRHRHVPGAGGAGAARCVPDRACWRASGRQPAQAA